MRTIMLLVALATLAAGCATPGSGTTTTTTPTTTSAGGANATGSPVSVKSDTHDFTTDAASGTPAGGASSTKFTVPAGVTTLNVTVKFAPAGPAPASLTDGVTVKVGGASCSLPAGPVQGPMTCTKVTPASGVTAIEYAGAGPVVATVTIMGT